MESIRQAEDPPRAARICRTADDEASAGVSGRRRKFFVRLIASVPVVETTTAGNGTTAELTGRAAGSKRAETDEAVRGEGVG